MDYVKILKRAFSITWNYRALWVFGIILALTAGGGANANFGNWNNGSTSLPRGNHYQPPGGFRLPEIPNQAIESWMPIAIAVGCLIVLLAVLFAIGRYVSETSLIRMVDEHEASAEEVSVRQGFRLGWSRASWRLFLIDLLIGLVGMLAFLLTLTIALAPLLVWMTDNTAARVMGSVVAIGMFILFMILWIVVGIAFSLIILNIRRLCVLENLGVMDSIRRGLAISRRHAGDILVMGIIMFGLGLLWVIVMIPVFIMLVLAGLILGGLPALLVGGISSLFLTGDTPWIIAGVIGLPLFLLTVAAPALFLNGLKETFKSSTWTLVYRELQTMESLDVEAPSLAPPSKADESDLTPASSVVEDDENTEK